VICLRLGLRVSHKGVAVIPELRLQFNRRFEQAAYSALLARLEDRCGVNVEFRVAETPIFVALALLEQMAEAGAKLAGAIMEDRACLDAARNAIPNGYLVARETAHPNFLTADFAFMRDPAGQLTPQLVELQAFPSVYGYQVELCSSYREAFGLDKTLRTFLGELDEGSYWNLLKQTIVGECDPENVVLSELDPRHQKTRPDFEVTARRLGIAIADIRSLEAVEERLHYRDVSGRLIPVHRIYNRAIADELITRNVRLPFDWTRPWHVTWASHPNWYFLISKFSIPWLSRIPSLRSIVPPAVFLDEFLAGPGRREMADAGVELPTTYNSDTILRGVVLKPLFSFAGKGILFDPTYAELEAIPSDKRNEFLLQQRMAFAPTIETPYGLTQAEIRILYIWPDGGKLTPALSLVRLGRGRMMGVDHNRDLAWVGASAAFSPG